MKSTSGGLVSGVGTDRRVPGWAAGLIAGLVRDGVVVVTRGEIADRLVAAGSERAVNATISELRRLGWLVGLPSKGVWAFMPPGLAEIADPYLVLRGWQARDPSVGFLLAGASAAWHLGYLDRDPGRPIPIWLPADVRLPDGLRRYVSVVQVRWQPAVRALLAPTAKLLVRRRLDLVSWANGLEAFGPEALIVQLATRPSSFAPWADLVTHLEQLADDCDDDRLTRLLAGQSISAWQRASYLLHTGGHPTRGLAVLDRRPIRALPKITFDHHATTRNEPGVWIAEYHLIDRLIVPLQRVVGKA